MTPAPPSAPVSAPPTRPLVASLGFGAMAAALAASLARRLDGPQLGGALLRPGSATPLPEGLHRWTDVADLIAARPQLVVECATHQAVEDSVPALLLAGIDVAIVSVGALARPGLPERIEAAARQGGARASVVSGAIGGLDVLRAARHAGLDQVTYIGRKPPAAWKGTPAEALVDLDRLTEARCFYEGTALEAARDYPKNTNVTAAVALAGLGFAQTRVRLIADPDAQGNLHELQASGAFGSFHITLLNTALPANPKTSWLAALSVEQAVIRHFSPLEI